MLTADYLSLEEKIGQLLIVGIEGNVPTAESIEMIQKYRVGGIILYKKNIESADKLLKLNNALKEANIANQVPLFICVDQEGGRVSRMPSEIKKVLPARTIASLANKTLISETGEIIGDMLSRFGINLNFAPVMDVGNFKATHAIGDRCFSNNADIVASYGIASMQAMARKGIIPAIKHFPGQGSVKADSHNIIIPSSPKKVSVLEKTDLLPFISAIKEGADAIMIGHINLSKLNWFAPATASHKVVTGLLRQKYGFDGVAITDDLCMASVEIQYGIKDLAARAINARNDMLIIKDPKKSIGVIEYIIKLVKKGKISEEDINESVNRILKLKEKYKISNKKIENCDVEYINKEISELNTRIGI